MPRNPFVSIPVLPDTGTEGLNRALEAMKQNIEMLCGMRGADDTAVTRRQIETTYPLSITGDNTTDIANLRETLRALMADLKE